MKNLFLDLNIECPHCSTKQYAAESFFTEDISNNYGEFECNDCERSFTVSRVIEFVVEEAQEGA